MTKFKYVLILLISLFFIDATCGDVKSDTGGLTRVEMEKAAIKIADQIALYFKSNPQKVFVALLPTKNETTEQFPVEVFDEALVKQLRIHKIFSLKTELRQDQLKELAFSQKIGQDFDIGNLKSPNYFVKARIDDNSFRSDGDKIVEQILTVEFIEVSSLSVVVSGKEVYSKKAKTGGLGW